MTNHWADMQHCKAILVEGSNVAENHPMAIKWIRKAQENGAIIIHVDPRFTRTSATADIYARIRPGADVAFLDAMINHVLVEQALRRGLRHHAHERVVPRRRSASTSRTGCSAASTRRSTSTTRRRWGYQLDDTGQPADSPRASTIRAASSRGCRRSSRATRSRSASASPASRRRRSSRSPRRWRRTGPAASSTRSA